MAKKELEMSIPKISLDELFTTQKQRDEAKSRKDAPKGGLKAVISEQKRNFSGEGVKG